MRALVQRVSSASVTIDGEVRGSIGNGLLILLGVAKPDSEADAAYLVEKIATLRIFPDSDGKMNLSLADREYGVLIVSQFTLYADVRRGRRPGFDRSAPPEQARKLYDYFVELFRIRGLPVATGVFQATMSVQLVNEGPVTILVDSEKIV